MSLFFSIDPGKRAVGWALWEARQLRVCGVSYSGYPGRTERIRQHKSNLFDVAGLELHEVRCVCEVMAQRGKFSEVNEADLLEVQLVAGALGSEYLSVQEWKGSCTREQEQERTRMKLAPEERAILEAVRGTKDAPAHNAWSAAGIGCHVLGRTINVDAEQNYREWCSFHGRPYREPGAKTRAVRKTSKAAG